ncbi:hypothetical protein [Acrocarpospora catenulata]|uniref:hypothetical protein n=1 Tax=Acrocarpospora catenulata TaxID=2836182 RepID=UPI001BD9C094|nr:hypothetical protein [Acrocarpospora catenulata]
MKKFLANPAARTSDQFGLVKNRLKLMQYRRWLLSGFSPRPAWNSSLQPQQLSSLVLDYFFEKSDFSTLPQTCPLQSLCQLMCLTD